MGEFGGLDDKQRAILANKVAYGIKKSETEAAAGGNIPEARDTTDKVGIQKIADKIKNQSREEKAKLAAVERDARAFRKGWNG